MPVALVTGSARGIGREIALSLARANYDLILHANRSFDELERLMIRIQQLGRRAWAIGADFSDPEQQDSFVKKIQEKYAAVDVLIHNAGHYEEAPFIEISHEHYRQMLAINLDAPFFITQGLLRLLGRSENPHVIHIIDSYAERPRSRQAHYSASKAALVGLTKALARELAPDIRVNGISPGVLQMSQTYTSEQAERIIDRIPLKMMGSAQDIADAVLFLVRDSTFITGQIFHIDGGRSIVS